MFRISTFLMLAVMSVLIAPRSTAAGVPQYLTFAGRLTDTEGQPVPDDTYALTVRIWDAAAGGNTLWTEAQNVATANGLFSMELGLVSPLNLAYDQSYWISVQVGDDAEMPRLPLDAVPYARRADDADKLSGAALTNLVQKNEADSVATGMLQDGSVSSAKLAPGAVGATQILDGSVTSSELANDAVTTSKIQNGAVTTSKLGSIAGYSLNTNYAGTLLSLINTNPNRTTLYCLANFNNGTAVNGYADDNGIGIQGGTWQGVGVKGVCDNTTGNAGDAVFGYSKGGKGLHGRSDTGPAVYSETSSGDLFVGYSNSAGNTRFRVTNAGNVQADGTYTSPAADFAEMMPTQGPVADYEPGDVLVIGDTPGMVVRCVKERSKCVVGIYSTRPAFLGGGSVTPDVDDQGRVPVAIVGIVPCKVSAENGAIRPGDLLVTAGTLGHAMREDAPQAGTILGKALGFLKEGKGVITVLVTLQ